MSEQTNPAEAFIRKRFETFKKMSEETSPEEAMQTMFAGYADQVKQRMEPYLNNRPWRKACGKPLLNSTKTAGIWMWLISPTMR